MFQDFILGILLRKKLTNCAGNRIELENVKLKELPVAFHQEARMKEDFRCLFYESFRYISFEFLRFLLLQIFSS